MACLHVGIWHEKPEQALRRAELQPKISRQKKSSNKKGPETADWTDILLFVVVRVKARLFLGSLSVFVRLTRLYAAVTLLCTNFTAWKLKPFATVNWITPDTPFSHKKLFIRRVLDSQSRLAVSLLSQSRLPAFMWDRSSAHSYTEFICRAKATTTGNKRLKLSFILFYYWELGAFFVWTLSTFEFMMMVFRFTIPLWKHKKTCMKTLKLLHPGTEGDSP